MSILAVVALAFVTSSQAAPILLTLSDQSNTEGEIGEVPASELNALVLLTVTGNNTLTIDITNTTDTLSVDLFDISAFVFNTSGQVSNIILTTFPNADGGYAQGISTVGGFGGMDWADGAKALNDTNPAGGFEIGQNLDLVNPGETESFVFSFDCSGTCDAIDFVQENSAGFLFAAKFINGGGLGGDSSWGGVVPEPGTASLLLFGLVGLAAVRRPRG